MAAYYPNTPTIEEQHHAAAFIAALAILYPCAHCAGALRNFIEEHPPRCESRKSLSLWMCEAHNEVNERLGLPQYACTVAALDERWRTGRDECWGEAGRYASSTTTRDGDESLRSFRPPLRPPTPPPMPMPPTAAEKCASAAELRAQTVATMAEAKRWSGTPSGSLNPAARIARSRPRERASATLGRDDVDEEEGGERSNA